MKKAGIFFVFITAIFIFKACVERKNVFDISGTWRLEKTEIYIEYDLMETFTDTGEKLTFYSDGLGKSGVFVFEWELTDDALLITEHGHTVKYFIRKKEKDILILEQLQSEHDPAGGKEILTLRR